MVQHTILLAFFLASSCALGVQLVGDRPLPESRSASRNHSTSEGGPPSKGRPHSKGSSLSTASPPSGSRVQSRPRSAVAPNRTEIDTAAYQLRHKDVPEDAKQLWIDIGAGEHPYATAPGTFLVLVEPDESVSSELLSRFSGSEYCSVAKVWIGKDTNATNSMTLAAFMRALPMKRFNQRIAKLKIDVGGEEGIVVAKSAGSLLHKVELVEAASGKNAEKTIWEPLMTSMGFKLRECYPRTWAGGEIDWICLWGNEHLETMAR